MKKARKETLDLLMKPLKAEDLAQCNPYERGFMVEAQSGWNKEISASCPFPSWTPEAVRFTEGRRQAAEFIATLTAD